MNLAASQNNNNITKVDTIRSSMRPLPFTSSSTSLPNEDHLITSRNSIWQQHAKHSHRHGTSPPANIPSNISLVNSMQPLGCGPPSMFSNESGATPTSSDQINEYDRTAESPNRIQQDRLNARITEMQKQSGRDLKNGAETTHNNCDNDNDEEVIVTNDDDECPKKLSKDLKRNDKNRYNSILSIR